MKTRTSQGWARRTRRNMLVLGVVLILLGAAAIPMFVGEVLLKLKARDWPEARARITGARATSGEGFIARLLSGNAVEVRFSYSQPAGTFDATQVVPARFAADIGVILPTPLIEQRQPNIRATCYYNPDNPREALVIRKLNRRDLRALLPLVPIALGIGVIVRGVRVARESQDPLGQFLHRNESEWEIQPAATGFRCVPKDSGRRLSLSTIAEALKGGPYLAIELIDYPLRRDRVNRMRFERPPGGEPRKIIVHLEVIGGLRDTKSSGQIVESTGQEPPGHVYTFEIPADVEPTSDLRLRITPEAGLLSSPPRFLWVQVTFDDPIRTAEAR